VGLSLVGGGSSHGLQKTLEGSDKERGCGSAEGEGMTGGASEGRKETDEGGRRMANQLKTVDRP